MGDPWAGIPARGASEAELAPLGLTLLAAPFDTITTMPERRSRKKPESAAQLHVSVGAVAALA